MSDNLVRRLKSPETFIGSGGVIEGFAHGVAKEAADLIKAQAAEITRLRAALATARRDALAEIKQDTDELIEQGRQDGLEEAAQIADRCTPRGHEGYDGAYNRGINTGTMQAKADIAAAIRSAAKEVKP